jgi:hypothetical protein
MPRHMLGALHKVEGEVGSLQIVRSQDKSPQHKMNRTA